MRTLSDLNEDCLLALAKVLRQRPTRRQYMCGSIGVDGERARAENIRALAMTSGHIWRSIGRLSADLVVLSTLDGFRSLAAHAGHAGGVRELVLDGRALLAEAHGNVMEAVSLALASLRPVEAGREGRAVTAASIVRDAWYRAFVALPLFATLDTLTVVAARGGTYDGVGGLPDGLASSISTVIARNWRDAFDVANKVRSVAAIILYDYTCHRDEASAGAASSSVRSVATRLDGWAVEHLAQLPALSRLSVRVVELDDLVSAEFEQLRSLTHLELHFVGLQGLALRNWPIPHSMPESLVELVLVADGPVWMSIWPASSSSVAPDVVTGLFTLVTYRPRLAAVRLIELVDPDHGLSDDILRRDQAQRSRDVAVVMATVPVTIT